MLAGIDDCPSANNQNLSAQRMVAGRCEITTKGSGLAKSRRAREAIPRRWGIESARDFIHNQKPRLLQESRANANLFFSPPESLPPRGPSGSSRPSAAFGGTASSGRGQ